MAAHGAAPLFRRVRKNELGLAGPEQLQLLADFHLLLAAAGPQPLDALEEELILMRLDGVLFLKTADFTVLLDQGGKALRAAKREPSVNQGKRERGHPTRSPRRRL